MLTACHLSRQQQIRIYLACSAVTMRILIHNLNMVKKFGIYMIFNSEKIILVLGTLVKLLDRPYVGRLAIAVYCGNVHLGSHCLTSWVYMNSVIQF